MKYLDIYTGNNRHIVVPDFSNFNISQLDSVATLHDLRYIIIDSIFDKKQEKGIVVNQDPYVGSYVKKNRRVYLTITCLQNRKVIFPEIYDLTLRQAVRKLNSLGIEVGHLDYRVNLAKNKVLDYSINGIKIEQGKEIYEGTVVDLVVGKGLSRDYIIVPNLVGLNRVEANIIVKSISLNIGTELFNTNVQDSAIAIIYKQRPAADNKRKISMGSSIDLFYKKFKEIKDSIK
ncbi:MAG: PASTA domain-containing protein [Bacteroidota bacterium]|nr:PASTA domain-containing protein [Bacteroidota bacterium]